MSLVDKQGEKMRTITEIIVHAAYTKPSMDIGADEIRRWHTDPKPKGRGWLDIGYNYVILRNGLIENGRDLDQDGDVDEEVGAHAFGHNAQSIGICLVGGMDVHGKPDSNFTLPQFLTLKILFDNLKTLYPEAKLLGHRDISSKPCPCFDVHELLKYSGVR